MSSSVTTELVASVDGAWSRLAAHPFVVELAAGELDADRFRFYLEQNLLYLPEYARVMALAAARSRDDRELEIFTRALRQVVEVELPENRLLHERIVALGAADRGGAQGPAAANRAYTSWLLSLALRGTAAEVLAAVLPCTWSYGVIGRLLAPTAADHPVYRGWLAFFAGEPYHRAVAQMRDDLDAVATSSGLDDSGRDRLSELFAIGVELELGFWQMAYAMDGPGEATATAGNTSGVTNHG